MNATLTETAPLAPATTAGDFPRIDFEQLEQWRQQRRSVETQLTLTGTPRSLWPYLSDTDTIERRAGFAAPELNYRPENEGRFLTGAASLAGKTLRFTELPFTWEQERFHSLERVFANGPFRYLCGQMELEQTGANTTTVTMFFHYVPRYRFLPTHTMTQAMQSKVVSTIKDLAAEIPMTATEETDRDRFAFAAKVADSKARRQRIDELAARWQTDVNDPDAASHLAEFILTRDESHLRRMRPFELAAFYSLEPMETLRFCLESVKQGYLEMQWDVLCPVCSGPAGRRTGLAQINEDAHCETCNIRYDVSFDENVEVTFRPAPAILPVQDSIFCPAAPASTKHVSAQHFLIPGESLELTLPTAPGLYQLRLNSERETHAIRIADDETPSRLDLATLRNSSEATSGPAGALQIQNEGHRVLTVKFEREQDRAYVTTAQQVTTLQEFRDRFSSEVLRPGVHIGVKKIALLFSDLKSSTELYEHEGDARALAIVQDHFERMTEIIADHGGAVVKTIGDAVMAVFLTPAAGFAAARAIQDSFHEYKNRGRDITLKLGLHAGPALALNRNENLDYFGTTVNRAARLETQSRGGDIVLSEELFADREVHALMKRDRDRIQLKRFRSSLKGFQEESLLYRVEIA